MKRARKAFLFTITLIATIMLLSCKQWDIFKKNYEYSENGKKEVEGFFEDILSETFSGTIKYKIKVVSDDIQISEIEYNRLSRTGEEDIVFFKMQNFVKNLGYYCDDKNSYLINYSDKTVSSQNDDIIEGDRIAALIYSYGLFVFKERQGKSWEFIEKKETTIKDSGNNDMKTVEYVYSYIPESGEEALDNTTTVKFNFHTKECKLERIYYNYSFTEKKDSYEIFVFIKEIKRNVSEADLALPGEEEGFIVINNG